MKRLIIFFIFALAFTFSVPSFTHALTLTSSSNNVGLNAGLVGWWTFDGKDVVNGRALDKSGSGNHGTLTNISTSTFYTTGKIGQGFRFDGVNDKISFTATNYGTTHSVSYWINYKDTGDGVVVGGINNNYATYISSPSSGGLIYYSAQGSLVNVVHGGLISGQWNYLTIVRNGTSVSFYKNGSQIGTTQTLGSNNSLTLSTLGMYSIDTFPATMVLDDVRIYNRALSAAEVMQLYNQGSATKQGVAQKVTATSTCSTGLSCGLVGYWSFDGKDVVNGRALDKSGSGNHGSLTNISTSTFYTTGKIGQGFKFDGVNDTVNIATNMFANRTEFSLMVWTKKTKGTTGSVFSSSNGGPYWRFTSATTILHYIEKSDCTGSSRGVAYPDDGKFHYIGFTVSTAGLVRFYVDGVVVDSYTYPSWNYACADATDWRSIGSYAVSNYFNGLIDDVRIYNRALSATEVLQLYNQGSATKQGVAQKVTATSTCSSGLSCGLVGYWSFDGKDVVNGVARDKSGGNNHGNLVNIATSTFYVPGKIGQGFKFDGVNDLINCGSSNSILTDVFTFAVWAKISAPSQTLLGLGTNTIPWIALRYAGNTPIIFLGTNNYRYFSATSPTNLSDGKWHHYVFIIKGNNQSDIDNSELYVDGRAQAVSSTVNTGPTSAKSLCKIGNVHASTPTNPFGGTMDDVRIYNRALSATEVTQLYNQGNK